MDDRKANLLSVCWLVVKIVLFLLLASSGPAGFVYQNF